MSISITYAVPTEKLQMRFTVQSTFPCSVDGANIHNRHTEYSPAPSNTRVHRHYTDTPLSCNQSIVVNLTEIIELYWELCRCHQLQVRRRATIRRLVPWLSYHKLLGPSSGLSSGNDGTLDAGPINSYY